MLYEGSCLQVWLGYRNQSSKGDKKGPLFSPLAIAQPNSTKSAQYLSPPADTACCHLSFQLHLCLLFLDNKYMHGQLLGKVCFQTTICMSLWSHNNIQISILIAVKLDTFPHCSSHTTGLVAPIINPSVQINTWHTSSSRFQSTNFSVILVRLFQFWNCPRHRSLDVTGNEMVERWYSHEKVLNARPHNMHMINHKAVDRGFQWTIPTLEREMAKYLCNQDPSQLTLETHRRAHSTKRECFPHSAIPLLSFLPPPHVRPVGLFFRFS